MKTLFTFLFGGLLIFSTATCSNISEEEDGSASAIVAENSMEITGTIQKQEMTSYQYGTHSITTVDEEFYALKSEAEDLNEYVNKEVTLIAEKIEGYPISGGPEYWNVLEVKEN